jgi:phosphonate transport system substrate-binding protein
MVFGLAIIASIFGFERAQADWRKDIGIFRIGIITTEQSIEVLDRLEPFKLAISEALRMDVEFFRAKNATALINALTDERIEYAVFSASGYALAWTACQCVEPVVIARSKDSTDGYHTILLSAPDGPKSLETIVGNEIGILSKNSISGPALASHVLAQQNVIIGDEKTPFITDKSAEDMLAAFAEGNIKLLIGWSSMTGSPASGYSRGNLHQLAENYEIPVRNYKILWKSEQIPHRPHVMLKKLHGDAKKILNTTLLQMNEKDPVAYDAIEPVYGGGFVTGRHERFEQLIGLMQAQDIQQKTAEETLPLQ